MCVLLKRRRLIRLSVTVSAVSPTIWHWKQNTQLANAEQSQFVWPTWCISSKPWSSSRMDTDSCRLKHAPPYMLQFILHSPRCDPRVCHSLLLLAGWKLVSGPAAPWSSWTAGDVTYNNFNWFISQILSGSWLSSVSVRSSSSLTTMLIESRYGTLMDRFFSLQLPLDLMIYLACVQPFIVTFSLNISRLHCVSKIAKEFKKTTNTLPFWCGLWGIRVISDLMASRWCIIY